MMPTVKVTGLRVASPAAGAAPAATRLDPAAKAATIATAPVIARRRPMSILLSQWHPVFGVLCHTTHCAYQHSRQGLCDVTKQTSPHLFPDMTRAREDLNRMIAIPSVFADPARVDDVA